MTSARHRVDGEVMTAVTRAETLTGNEFRGVAPRGMWWVAWRQHRVAVIVGLVMIGLLAGALACYYLLLDSRVRAAGCVLGTQENECLYQPSARYVVTSTVHLGWDLLSGAMIVAPTVIGAFVGTAVFAREFERGTQVFALTQSVSRLRWWATKSAVLGVPILAGLIGLGFVAQWVQDRNWPVAIAGALNDGAFQIRGIMPAAYGLVGLAAALTAGLLIRSTIPALVASLVVGTAIVILVGFPLRPHLLTPTRNVQPIGSSVPPDAALLAPSGRNDWYLGNGYLDAAGHPVPFDIENDCPAAFELMMSPPGATWSPDDQARLEAKVTACQQERGIVASYVDYLPARMVWPLQLVQLAICAAIAALFLGLGSLRLRVLPRSRT